MKIQLFFKCPDVIRDISEEVASELGVDLIVLTDEQKEQVEEKKAEILAGLEKWVEYGECISVEFDTKMKTMIVLEV